MIYTGMIFQYDSTQGTGLIMLSDGEKKEFSSKDWTDAVNSPAIGQKISYKNDANGIEIKVANEEDTNKPLADKEQKNSEEENVMKDFTSLDDYLKHFLSLGFNLVKDTKRDESRTITLRSYTTTEFREATITQSGSKISIEQTLDGKPININ